jgi:putative hydrolase of the HAD superfamily
MARQSNQDGEILLPRAILFDLDDTLYPLRRFVRSGFIACAAHLQREAGLDPKAVLAALAEASTGPGKGRELQVCAARFELPTAMVEVLVGVIRNHAPVLTLPRASRLVLAELRPGWRLGLVTNGDPERQARKVAALGLSALVEVIVYADGVGDGRGKPQPEPFLEAARRLDVTPDRTVFVGDDPRCDIFGAGRIGMRTVRRSSQRHHPAAGRDHPADATITSLARLPAVVDLLVPAYRRQHVA